MSQQRNNRAYTIRPDTRTLLNMGVYLAKARKRRARTQLQVGDAIGMPFQYVSDVENGRRGKCMNQFVAVKWADYLGFDAKHLFHFLGLVDKSGKTDAVMAHLRGAVMAQSWVTSRRLITEVDNQLRATRKRSRDRAIRDDIEDQRHKLQRVLALLRTPENVKVNVPEKSNLVV